MTALSQPASHAVVRDGVLVSTDPELLDLDLVHRFLSEEAYWSTGVAREVVERSIAASIPFGAYRDGRQLGFARVVTDGGATFAWIADVFVLAPERGSGLGKLLMESMLSHPALQGLRRWLLATADAHGLYERYGFVRVDERFMVRESATARLACVRGG